MPGSIEREIKLRFTGLDEARAAIARAGGRLRRERRLQDDWLLDTPDQSLGSRRSVLRVRFDGDRGFVTFKGPVEHAAVKARAELETEVADGGTTLDLFQSLGYRLWFRYQKYREEYDLSGVIAAIDDTPVGIYVELEGAEDAIAAAAVALGRGPADYLLDSYRRLYLLACDARGVAPSHMIFEGD